MAKTTSQAGANFIARDRGVMSVPEVVQKQQPIKLSVRISKNVKRRVTKKEKMTIPYGAKGRITINQLAEAARKCPTPLIFN